MNGEAILSGFKYFKLKGLKGTPQPSSREDMNMMFSMWAEALDDIPPDIFVTACKILSDEQTFFPALAEVRQKCLALRDGIQPTGAEIWPELKALMLPSAYPYASPQTRSIALNSIECPTQRKAAELFDWGAFARSGESDESYHRHEFTKLFDSLQKRMTLAHEAQRHGLTPPPSLAGLIGDMTATLTRGDECTTTKSLIQHGSSATERRN